MTPDKLLEQKESEWLDFKREHHANNAKLLHDILCLANAQADGERYLVFGVQDAGALVGVEHDERRKTNADLHDFLRSVHLARIPTCHLDTHTVGVHEVDVLTIRNRPDKPFFLLRDYKHHGDCVRAGVIYTRLGDTNIPLAESAPEDHVELMWRERFGIGLSPLERVEQLLEEPAKWEKIEDDGYMYHSDFPEFTIVDGDTIHESFEEEWTKLYPDRSARSFTVEVRYLTTVLRQYIFVSCDGARYRIPLPERTGGLNPRFTISQSSPEWNLAQIYRQHYSLHDPSTLPGVELVD